MKNKKGFTLVELLVVIAILAILAIVATPRIIDLFNDAKKNAFVSEVQGIYKIASNTYLSENLKGNLVSEISNDGAYKLNMDGKELTYYIKLDNTGNVTYMEVYDGEYCIKTNKRASNLSNSDVIDGPCSSVPDSDANPEEPIVPTIITTTSTLDKNKLWSFANSHYITELYFVETGSSSGTNISNNDADPIYAWMEGNKMYVSAASANTRIKLPQDSSYLFHGSDVSNITSGGFKRITELDVSGLDTSNVTNMEGLFYYLSYYSSRIRLTGLENFDTSKVTNMSHLFQGVGCSASSWSISDIRNWNTSNVENMEYMFSIIGDDTSTSAVTMDLHNWDVSKVTTMESMFLNFAVHASSLEININGWNTSNLVNMGQMFDYAGSEASSWNVVGIENINVSNVQNIGGIFATVAKNVDTFELDLSRWNTSNVTDMFGAFQMTAQNARVFKLNLSNWDTSKVETPPGTSYMGWMFRLAGESASIFEIKIPKRSNGVMDNTTTRLYGKNDSANINYGNASANRVFTLVN